MLFSVFSRAEKWRRHISDGDMAHKACKPGPVRSNGASTGYVKEGRIESSTVLGTRANAAIPASVQITASRIVYAVQTGKWEI
jgi:hypothetical protein